MNAIPTYVLDACALIALINTEKGWEKVDDLFRQARAGRARLYINIVNLVEVYYDFWRADGKEGADVIMAPVLRSPLQIVETITPAIYEEVTRLKSTLKGFSLADAFGLGTAAVLGGTFVTSDHHELDAIERQVDIPFLWIRPRPAKGGPGVK